MKHIVLFGAGKSSTYLIGYLLDRLSLYSWKLSIVDADESLARSRAGNHPLASGYGMNIQDDLNRRALVAASDLVISLLPPSLHYIVALDCLAFGKDLLTASYIDQNCESLRPAIEEKGLLFLFEMGLDPGIDHMSAMSIIDKLHRSGAHIHSFRSHCGGLVAPESDDNPWRYKISWNPHNVILAGKLGAVYRENGRQTSLTYEPLFNPGRTVDVPGLGSLAWYPNRDSLQYLSAYRLSTAETFVRTTLRFPEFCFGWKNVVMLRLTDETPQYDTTGMSLKTFFHEHLRRHGFTAWIESQLTSRFRQTTHLLDKLQQLLEAEEQVSGEQLQELQEFMLVNDDGQLRDVNLEQVKNKAARVIASRMHEANLALKQLFFLGLDDDETIIDKGYCSAADVLQFAMEKKMTLQADEHDMIVMLHEIRYQLDSVTRELKSTLILTGENSTRTAMARTVGLPLAIAASMILRGTIRLSGLHIPVHPAIYTPVLQELASEGIAFSDVTSDL